jgi:hypothetical protein
MEKNEDLPRNALFVTVNQRVVGSSPTGGAYNQAAMK